MSDKTRVDLLKQIQALQMRLEERDRQIERLKELSVLSPPSEDSLKKKRTVKRLDVSKPPEPLDWFGQYWSSLFGDGVYVAALDGRGVILWIAGDWSNWLSLEPEQIVGKKWLRFVVSEDRTLFRNYHEAFKKHANPKRLNIRLQIRPEEVQDVELSVCQDLQQPKNSWLAIRRLNTGSIATEGRSEASRWAGIFAHEMNQPLAAVLTTAQACLSLQKTGRAKPSEITPVLEMLAQGAAHAGEIVRRLRTLAGGEVPCREPTQLGDVVRYSLQTLQGMLSESRVTVSLDLANDSRPVSVDPVQINQVIVNLARNAIEAMNSTPGPLRHLTVRAMSDAEGAVVAIEDHGPGLPVDLVDRLFSPVPSSKPTGMGLGLAICRQIIEAHGGRIRVKGNSPSGCVFFFSIPWDTSS